MINKNKLGVGLSIALLLILIITTGISFAFFTANITGVEEQDTIVLSGGVMNITYSGGSNINALNMVPKSSPFGTKTFTVTGNSTANADMNYQVVLYVSQNTFSNNTIKYKLTSTNTGSNGTVVPSSSGLVGIASGSSREINLGNGKFVSPTNGNKVHTYVMEMHFPDSGTNQNQEQGKVFGARILVRGV